MTAPTREQVEDWARAVWAERYGVATSVHIMLEDPVYKIAALAFAAGQSGQASGSPTWTDGAPPKPWSGEWFIAETTYGDRVVLTELPDEYAYDFKTADDTYLMADKVARWMQFPDSEYKAFAAASGSGAELVREVEEAAKSGPLPGGSTGDQIICRQVAQSLVHCDWWPRLHAALLAGDAAREDAERMDWLDQQDGGISCDGYSDYRYYFGDVFESARAVIDRARGGK